MGDLDIESGHLLAIYRGWQRAMHRATLPRWLYRSGREITLGLAVLSLVFLILLDEPLWLIRFFTGPSTPWVWLAPRSGAMVGLVFILVWAINSWIFHGLLVQITREPWRYRPWILRLRSVLAGFPQFGILIVPSWRWVDRTGPSWSLRPSSMPPELSLARQKETPAHPPGSFLVLAWLVASGFGACALLVLWMMKRALVAPSLRAESLLVSTPLRGAIFASLMSYLRSDTVRLNAPPRLYRQALVATSSWLIPIPFIAVVGMVALLFVEPTTALSNTLLWQVLVRRDGVGRLPLWLYLEDTLREGWTKLSVGERLWKPPRAVTSGGEIQRAETEVLRLYDLQTFSLVFDLAALGWGLSWLAGHDPAWLPLVMPVSKIIWLGSLGLCTFAICLSAAHFLLVLLRVHSRLRILDRHPYSRYLFRTQLATTAGFLLGSWVQQGQAQQGGMVLMYLCTLLAIFSGLLIIIKKSLPKTPSMRERFQDYVHEIGLLFLLMPVFGIGGPLGLLPRLFAIWVGFAPVRAWLLGRALLPWLLRPFMLRDLSSDDLPGRLRWQIGVLSAAAMLPFGGLAIPACIWIQHRIWPEAANLSWRRQRC